MSESVAALTLCAGGGAPCGKILPGRAATAITPNATSESDEVARMRTELKTRTGLTTVTRRRQDFVDSSFDVIQSECHWIKLDRVNVVQTYDQRPGLRECGTGRSDLSSQEFVGEMVYRRFRLASQSRVFYALSKNISGVMKLGSEHGQIIDRQLWRWLGECSRPDWFAAAGERDKKSDGNRRCDTGPPADFFRALWLKVSHNSI
jgi:hypothetical protein